MTTPSIGVWIKHSIYIIVENLLAHFLLEDNFKPLLGEPMKSIISRLSTKSAWYIKLWLIAILGLTAPIAHSATLGINVTNTTGEGLGNPPFTLGWSFTAENNINVTDLGLFDDSQDGFVDSHAIGLWDASRNLLVSATIPSGTTSTLDGVFRFVSVTPTSLSAGQDYFIGALYSTGNDALIFPGFATGFSTSPDITFDGTQFAAGGALTFPADSVGDDPAYFGPNFRYTLANDVPEPASLALIASGLIGFRFSRRNPKQA